MKGSLEAGLLHRGWGEGWQGLLDVPHWTCLYRIGPGEAPPSSPWLRNVVGGPTLPRVSCSYSQEGDWSPLPGPCPFWVWFETCWRGLSSG